MLERGITFRDRALSAWSYGRLQQFLSPSSYTCPASSLFTPLPGTCIFGHSHLDCQYVLLYAHGDEKQTFLISFFLLCQAC